MPYKDILLIDDDIEDAELFVEAISSLQKDVKCRYTTDSVKAFGELKTSEKLPDLLFLDINMPRLNGFELLRELKKDPRLSHIDVILISSASEELMHMMAPESDMARYMPKPCSYSAFIAQLNEVLFRF